jgi:hypothetical protein
MNVGESFNDGGKGSAPMNDDASISDNSAHSRARRPMRWRRGGANLLVALAALGWSAATSRAQDKPPVSPDQATALTTESRISAAIEIGIPALDGTLDRMVPRRLASFQDRTTSCWHRRILGRDVNVDCTYSGYVERTGPISLRAEGGRLVASSSLYGTVTGRGTHRLTGLIHGTADGQMTLYVTAQPRLRPDWSVSLDMREGFRWNEPPVLTILGFSINLTRFVEPRISSQLVRVRSSAENAMRSLNLRSKAEAAWRQAFTAVKIVDAPQIWLRMTPQSVAFAGTHARGNSLDGAVEIAGTTETVVGSEPPVASPTPLPRLGDDVTEPGRFEVIVPIAIDYPAIAQKIRDQVTERAQAAGFALREVDVYPSAGKIVVGLRVAPEGGADTWVYITATPGVDADNQAVALQDMTLPDSIASAAPQLAALMKDSDLLQSLQQQLRMSYQAELQRILASASERLSRPLGNGFRSEGELRAAGVAGFALLADGLRLNLLASGRLTILYGL